MIKNQNWNLFRQGDKAAFERIYREQISSLYAYGKKISTDDTLVEDCIQDLFIYLWDKRATLGDSDNYRAYLFVSLRRRIIKAIKSTRLISSIDNNKTFQATLAIDSIIELSDLKKEQATKLKTAFDKLNKNQQQILYLKYYQGFNGKEIASILHINNQSARNGLSRALSKLKSQMMVLIFLLTESMLYGIDISVIKL